MRFLEIHVFYVSYSFTFPKNIFLSLGRSDQTFKNIDVHAIKRSRHAWSSKFPYSQYLARSTTRHSHALMDSPSDWNMRPIFVRSAWTLTLPPKRLMRALITFTGSLLSSSDSPSVLLFGLINLFIFEGRVARSVDMQRFCFFHCFFPSSLWSSYLHPSFRSNHPITVQ